MGSIGQTVQGALGGQVMMGVGAVLAATAAAVAWFWAKHPVRWILAIATVVLVVVVARGQADLPRYDDLDPFLPSVFKPPLFSWWVLALSLSALYLSAHLAGTCIRARTGESGEATGEAGFPDLDAAWDEIQIRLSHAHYDPTRQSLFLILAPEESLAASLMEAAGLQFFARAPADPSAPIHAFATADGLFLSCAGATSWGRGGEEGTARLATLCRMIRDLNPDKPVLRGVAVLYPMERAASTEVLQGLSTLRNDLQAIRAELHMQVPTFAIFCLREAYGGFEEFAARVPPSVRARRCGFSVPVTQRFDLAAATRGLDWLVQWFSTWSLNLMTDEPRNSEGNRRLIAMCARLRREVPALSQLLNASFSTHAQAEPIQLRGCYFVACGPGPEDRAFAPGLVNGKASKLIADAVHATWSRGADAIDRRHRLVAIVLALATAAIALPIWISGIIDRLQGPDVVVRYPAAGWIAGAVLSALVLAWIAGFTYLWLRDRLDRRVYLGESGRTQPAPSGSTSSTTHPERPAR